MASALGTAASGQDWDDSGNWAIEETDQAYALFGNALTLPLFYGENGNIYGPGAGGDGHVGAAKKGDDPTLMGEGGVDTDPVQLYVDRPTLLQGKAQANVTNDASTESFHVRFYLVYDFDGDIYTGRQTNVWTPNADKDGNAGGNIMRFVHTINRLFIPGTVDAPITVNCWWGYGCDDAGAARFITIRNQFMELTANYAPDYSDSFTTTKRSQWTRSGTNRVRYRKHGPPADLA